MFRDMRPRSRALIAATTLGLIVAPLTLAQTAQANPGGTGLVISEVYGGGNSAGVGYGNDFIELYNPTASPIDVTGWSVQYRSATGTGAPSVTPISGVIPAGKHYLVQEGNFTTGIALPTPDATGSISMSGSNGVVLLVNNTTSYPETGDLAGDGGALVDAVGYGSTPTTFEGANSGTALTTSTSAFRNAAGADTDNNAADFATGTPNAANCDCAPPPPPDVTGPIAAIQGAGAVSPHVGATATTRGVVTAAYPTGGFSGFYLQTPGTGGARDLNAASDGIFVFVPGGTLPAAATVGNYVEVVGEVSEFNGLTEITADSVTDIDEAVTAPTASTTTGWPTTDAQRESLEGMLYRPSGDYTVSNTFTTNQFGEIGLASGTKPLIQRTEVELPGPAGSSAVEADNAARRVALDDGASTNFLATTTDTAICGTRPTPCLVNGDQTPAYVSNTKPVVVGAAVEFTDDVVVDWRNSAWKFQPTTQVVGPDNTNAPATFENTRTAAPDSALINEAGTADLKVASFNVLNYFTTLGTDSGTCVPFTDRDGGGSTVSTGCDQRGAWDAQDLAKQQEKIVSAINALDADVVGLMEIENSAALGETADEAIGTLVAALNADAGAGTWAVNPSSVELPAATELDVISNAIIYKPAAVERVGASRALGTQSGDGQAFNNAREPLGQVFAPVGGGDPFLFVVNHFKSKGSAGPFPGDADQNDGQGASQVSREMQATALKDWIPTVLSSTATPTEAVVLAGDFNSYTEEDPLHVLYDAGFTNVEKQFENGEYSYSFSGLSGSLDHILVNDAALERSTGTDIWNINGGESLALEYSRWNYHATDFHQDGPYRSSDHDPVILGLTAAETPAEMEVQILGTNDFHGRLLANGSEAGAATLAGAVKQLRAENPNTVFAAAGDLIGASTFESFIQKDKPTIDALNEAGLDVSAVGNHEFDAGYDDLINRVMAEGHPEGGAEWQYIGANVKLKATGDPAVPASWVRDFGAVEVGFIGAVTEDLPSLVSPDGIEDIVVTDIVEAANETADDLEAEGADVIVLLVHEGAATTNITTATDDSAFGQIVKGVNADIDAIVSGHTHLAYNHAIEVPEWVTEGRAVTTRPVVSAGQYGTNLNQLKFTVDTATGEVMAKSQAILPLVKTPAYPVDAPTKAIVDEAVAEAEELGAVELGQIGGPFNRAKLADGTTENRGGESTLGNLVAEVQRWATETPEAGAAQIAFMNPGGLRQDMTGSGTGAYPRTLTYKQAAVVQPFANTLVNMQMTGAQIKTALEQQWQRDNAGNIPTRPFLRLGTSKGFRFTYDPSLPEGSRVVGMWLNGTRIDPSQSYSVTVNSFLASGGDNFRVFGQVAGKRDTGKSDLTAMVDYMAEFADGAPLPVDYKQHAVGVDFPASAPPSYIAGGQVRFDLSSLAFSNAADLKDSQVRVSLGDTELGAFPVDNTIGTAVFDEYGKASVNVTLPGSTPQGPVLLTVTGLSTGTVAQVPITVAGSKAESTVTVQANPDVVKVKSGTSTLAVTVTAQGHTPSGFVAAYLDGQYLTSAPLANGEADLTVGPFDTIGDKTIEVRYFGDDLTLPGQGTDTVVVQKGRPKVNAGGPATATLGKSRPKVTVTVSEDDIAPTGTVVFRVDGVKVAAKSLSGGKASVELKRFFKAGRHLVEVTYKGSDLLLGGVDTHVIRVVR